MKSVCVLILVLICGNDLITSHWDYFVSVGVEDIQAFLVTMSCERTAVGNG